MTIFPVAASGILNGPINCVTMLNFVAIGQTVPRYGDFLIFQDGGPCHLGFLKFRNVNRWNGKEGRTASTSQISWRSVKPRYEDMAIFRFFPRWRPPPSWIFKI